jgi:hypothetical protein
MCIYKISTLRSQYNLKIKFVTRFEWKLKKKKEKEAYLGSLVAIRPTRGFPCAQPKLTVGGALTPRAHAASRCLARSNHCRAGPYGQTPLPQRNRPRRAGGRRLARDPRP